VSVGAPVERAELGDDLVEGERQEIGELDEGDGTLAREGAADRGADNGRFRQRRVAHTAGEGRRQPPCHAEHVAFGILDILAQHIDVAVRRHLVAQHPVQRFAHRKVGRGRVAAIFLGLREALRVGRLG
jgi:hypothetical protein